MTPNWAIHSQAQGVAANSTMNIEYDMCGILEVRNLDVSKYDLLFAMGLLGSISHMKPIKLKPYVTLVHHYPWSPGWPMGITKEYITKELDTISKGLRHASISKRIQSLWLKQLNIGSCYLPSGVDCNRFYPVKKVKKDYLTIGFCGNVTKKLKGFHDIIEPAINRLQREGCRVKLKVKGYENLVSHEKMPEFYKDIDVYICASSAEGLPTPLVEACACGIPFVSTDVGVVKEIDLKGYNIIVQRNIPSLVAGIKEMFNADRRKCAGELNRAIMESGWDWKDVAKIWEAFIIGDKGIMNFEHKQREKRICRVVN